jgi:ketosteroid isomerase-like protein
LSAVADIGRLLDDWATAVRAHDLDGASRHRSEDIVMFDVPEPLQSRGLAAYRDTWTLYFKDPGSRRFDLVDRKIVAGEDVAWVHAILQCTTGDEPAGRLTAGLRRIGGKWVVEHEHHSFPIPLGQ